MSFSDAERKQRKMAKWFVVSKDGEPLAMNGREEAEIE